MSATAVLWLASFLAIGDSIPSTPKVCQGPGGCAEEWPLPLDNLPPPPVWFSDLFNGGRLGYHRSWVLWQDEARRCWGYLRGVIPGPHCEPHAGFSYEWYLGNGISVCVGFGGGLFGPKMPVSFQWYPLEGFEVSLGFDLGRGKFLSSATWLFLD